MKRARDRGHRPADRQGAVGGLPARRSELTRMALEACRGLLFPGSLLRRSAEPILLWGRPHAKPGESLKETTFTQFAPRSLDRRSMRLCSCSTAPGGLDYDEGEAALSGPPRHPVPQRPRPWSISVSILARREEVERLPGRQQPDPRGSRRSPAPSSWANSSTTARILHT